MNTKNSPTWFTNDATRAATRAAIIRIHREVMKHNSPRSKAYKHAAAMVAKYESEDR